MSRMDIDHSTIANNGVGLNGANGSTIRASFNYLLNNASGWAFVGGNLRTDSQNRASASSPVPPNSTYVLE